MARVTANQAPRIEASARERRGCARIVLRVAKWAAVAVVALVLVGALFQAWVDTRFRRDFPPPGTMTEVSGVALHLLCSGEGSPTVLLEAGLGAVLTNWRLVQPEVARHTRVCSYDRAGLGWSERGPRPRTSEQITTELNALLDTADIARPLVLVGHSFGGLHVRVYTSRFPEEVAGLVLVDPSHERQLEELPAPPAGADFLVRRLLPVLSRLGTAKLLAPALLGDYVERLAPVELAMAGTSKFLRGQASEYAAVAASAQAAQAMPRSLADRPLVVVSASRVATPPGMTAEEVAAVEATIAKLHTDLASLSTGGRRVVSGVAGHLVQLDDPGLVTASILEVVEAVRSGPSEPGRR